MAVLTDLFIATDPTILSMPEAVQPLTVFPGVALNGMLPTDFVELYAVLTHEAYNEELIDTFILICEHPSDGPWVYRLPPALLETLAAQAPSYVARNIQQWVMLQRGTVDNRDSTAIVRAVHQVVRLAQQALAEGKSLYLWVCL